MQSLRNDDQTKKGQLHRNEAAPAKKTSRPLPKIQEQGIRERPKKVIVIQFTSGRCVNDVFYRAHRQSV